jgi:uncharacterized protein GlcG (DUF336 family)
MPRSYIDLAIDKAATARIFNRSTSELASLGQSGKPLFGIQATIAFAIEDWAK